MTSTWPFTRLRDQLEVGEEDGKASAQVGWNAMFEMNLAMLVSMCAVTGMMFTGNCM